MVTSDLMSVSREFVVESWDVIIICIMGGRGGIFIIGKDLRAGKVTAKAILHHRTKSKVEKRSQDVTACHLPWKATTLEEFQ